MWFWWPGFAWMLQWRRQAGGRAVHVGEVSTHAVSGGEKEDELRLSPPPHAYCGIGEERTNLHWLQFGGANRDNLAAMRGGRAT